MKNKQNKVKLYFPSVLSQPARPICPVRSVRPVPSGPSVLSRPARLSVLRPVPSGLIGGLGPFKKGFKLI